MEAELHDVLDRIMGVWSRIKMVPERDLASRRASVLAVLEKHQQLPERELLLLGLKHLFEIDGPENRL
jgi:hypothetical protein